MLILYVGVEEYRDKAKESLLINMEDNYNLEFPWTRLFYEKLVEFDRDGDFLKKLLSSIVGRKILHAFFHFLEETESSLSSCADIILGLCHSLLETDAGKDQAIWYYQDDISKMIMALYDTESEEENGIAMECLNLWDIMYEKRTGAARELTKR